VLGDEQGSQEGDELLVRDVRKRVMVDDRLAIRVACTMMKKKMSFPSSPSIYRKI
jgi:hypothetical protein